MHICHHREDIIVKDIIEANNMIANKDNIVVSIWEELARELPTRSQVKESLRKELNYPEISLFRNIRHMTLAQWDTFILAVGCSRLH